MVNRLSGDVKITSNISYYLVFTRTNNLVARVPCYTLRQFVELVAMDTSAPSKRIYRFGLFEADASSGQLLRRGSRVRMQDQPFRLLIVLLEQAGTVVTREQLRQQLWPSNTYVEFDGSLNNTLKKLRSALGDSAENPTFVETIPKRGYRFIAPVESLDAPVTGSQFDPPSVPGTVTAEPALRRRRRWRRALVAAATFILVASGLVASYHRLPFVRKRSQLLTQPQTKPRLSVAILGFHNTSGRPQDGWLSTALSEMLSTELAQGDKLRVVSGEDVAQLRMVAPWTQTDTLGQETTARLGNTLSSDLLVLGSYTSVGKADHRQLRLDVRLQESVSGNILTEIAETGREEDLFRLTSSIGNRLHQRLGMPGATETEQAEALASLPSNPQAARCYALGLDKLRQFDALSAKDLFEQAIRADPKFPLSHSMLARAWNQLGYEQNRQQEAKAALALSTNLPRTDRMLVEGDYYESQANHAKASSTYRALFALFPDSVEYGLQLAATQTLAGESSQARETISQLRRLPPPGSNDPRIDLAEARTVTNSNRPQAIMLLRNALAKAASQGKKLVYAQARKEECMHLIYGDHPDQGAASCEDAYATFLAAGNRLAAADCLRLIGDGEGAAGHSEQAIATYQRALHVLQELGEHTKTATVLNNMAVVYLNKGQTGRAEQLYRQAEYHFEQAGDKYDTATALGNIADVLYLRGNLLAAARLYQQTIEIEGSLEVGDPSYALYRLADLELTQGLPRQAFPHAEKAVALLRPAQGGYQYLTGAMAVLGDVLMAEDDLKGAREQYRQTLEIRQKMHETDLVAESQESIAEVSIEEGHAEQAESLLRQSIIKFESEKTDPDASSAYTLLSRALLAEGKFQEAQKAIRRARELSLTSSGPALTLPAAIENARIEAATSATEDAASRRSGIAAAEKQLRSAVATAKHLGYYHAECEARLALGELEAKTHGAQARSQLAQLAHDAHQRGLELIARKAEELEKSIPRTQ